MRARVIELIVARHGHAASNTADIVNCRPPGDGLSALGAEQARGLREALDGTQIDLGASTRLLRTQETLRIALTGRNVPTLVVAELDEIDFGSFEGRPLASYRHWAWANEPDVPCPGGGESRAAAAARFADGLSLLLRRPERTILAIGHALPLRYALDAADGVFPAARVEPIAHAVPHRLERAQVETAIETLRAWAAAPRFADVS